MDERPVKPDSSLFITSKEDSLTMAAPVRIKTKEWIGGVTIVLVLSLSLILLFNLRSR